MKGADQSTSSPDCEIVSSRIIAKDRNLVFRAWTEPEHLKNWWGPNGFTNTFYEYDLQPGGKWRFMMHGPDKGNYPNECVFLKIEKPEMISWDRLSQPIFRVVALFDELPGNHTRVTFKMIFATAAECSKIRSFAPAKNEENFDRLEMELEKMKAEA